MTTYTPSGNPTTGSEGLSALIRAEFAAIAAAFSGLPAITTEGAFSTILVQVGDFTFTLPASAGTLAMLSDIAVETTRAEAAEALLAPKISPAFTGGVRMTLSPGPGAVLTLDTASDTLLQFQAASFPVGSISTTGTAVAYNTTSDEDLKDIAGPITAAQAGSFIDGLEPIWYSWKSDPSRELQPGFGAQTTAKVFPWAVTPGDEERPWTMDMAKLVVAAIAEIKSLRERVTILEQDAP